MNQQQIKYARERIGEIYTKLKKKIAEDHTIEAVTLTLEEKIQAIKDGEFSVPITDHKPYYNNLNNLKFNKEAPRLMAEGFDKAIASLEVKRTKLLDDLMLGDAEDALNALSEFENGEYN